MALSEVHLYWDWLYWDWRKHWTVPQHLNWPQHWNRHSILHALSPLHWVFASLFSTAAIAMRKWQQRLWEGRAANWSSVKPTVLSVSVKANHGCWVQIDYRFFARDEYRYGKSLRHFRSKNVAEQFAADMRAPGPVHYRQDDPNISVLIEDELQLAGQMVGSLGPRC